MRAPRPVTAAGPQTPDDAGASRAEYLQYTTARNHLARRHAAFANELRYMRAAMPTFPAGRVLDVGCGTGVFSEFLRQEGIDAWGLDFDLALVRSAAARTGPPGGHPRVLVARVEQLPYQDATFGACIADSILEHVPHWQDTLREAARVLQPGGLLVFYTANRWHPFTQEVNHVPLYPWMPARLKRVLLDWIMASRPALVNYTAFPAVNWFTYEELRAFLEPLGFDVRTRLDLLDGSALRGWKKALAAMALPLRRTRPLRWLYYLYARDVSVYAVKTRRGQGES